MAVGSPVPFIFIVLSTLLLPPEPGFPWAPSLGFPVGCLGLGWREPGGGGGWLYPQLTSTWDLRDLCP